MLLNEKLREMKDRLKASGIESWNTDAEVLMAYALSIERYRLYMDQDRVLSDSEEQSIESYTGRREKYEPVAYITGHKEFYSLDLKVTPDVLIPRPETELLVDMAIYYTPQNSQVLDLCTGSGAVAVSLKHCRNDAEVWASDLSAAALEVAKFNAEKILGGDSIHFVEGDLFLPFADMKFNVIVSNPPYVDRALECSLQKDLSYEPEMALYSHDEGREIIEKIISEAKTFLSEDGILLLEIGEKMKEFVKELGEQKGFTVSTLNDLAGLPRVAVLKV